MAQQCFNYLQKAVGKVLEGKSDTLLPILKYLTMIKNMEQIKCKVSKVDDWLDIDQIEEAMKMQVCYGIKNIIERRKVSKATKKDFNNSVMALDIVKVSQAHIKLVTFMLFRAKLIPNPEIPMKTFKNKINIDILSQFGKLYGLISL